jgi:hypothetical protein
MSGQNRRSPILTAAATFFLTSTAALAEARTPTISGNGWVALMIIIGAIAIIYFFIMGALGLESRDARMGRRKQDDGWFGIFPSSDPDEEDAPDFHHTGDDGGGGDGGN